MVLLQSLDWITGVKVTRTLSSTLGIMNFLCKKKKTSLWQPPGTFFLSCMNFALWCERSYSLSVFFCQERHLACRGYIQCGVSCTVDCFILLTIWRNQLTFVCLVGGSQSTRREPTQVQGEHTNSAQKCPARPQTQFLLAVTGQQR